jgi:putative CocE/NonD family hydrolase
MFGVPEGPPIRTELDRKAQVYTSVPLDQDTRVLGHPIVHLWASSTANDGDFFFYLEDVAPDGQATLVSEYGHRAGFATLRNNDEIIPHNPGIDVKPDLPWHGFKAAEYQPRIFAGGHVAEIVTALYPTGWLFKKGHAIRLSITAADWPTFSLHPALAPSNRPDDPKTIVPTITFHWGGARASYVELPVVP